MTAAQTAEPSQSPQAAPAKPYVEPSKAAETAKIVAGVAIFSVLHTTGVVIAAAVTQKVTLAGAFALIAKGLGLAALGTAGSIALLYGLPLLILIGSLTAICCSSTKNADAPPSILDESQRKALKLKDIADIVQNKENGLEDYQAECVMSHLQETSLNELDLLYNLLRWDSITPLSMYSTLVDQALHPEDSELFWEAAVPQHLTHCLPPNNVESAEEIVPPDEEQVRIPSEEAQPSYPFLPALQERLLEFLSDEQLAIIQPQLETHPEFRQRGLVRTLQKAYDSKLREKTVTPEVLLTHFQDNTWETQPQQVDGVPPGMSPRSYVLQRMLHTKGLSIPEAHAWAKRLDSKTDDELRLFLHRITAPHVSIEELREMISDPSAHQ